MFKKAKKQLNSKCPSTYSILKASIASQILTSMVLGMKRGSQRAAAQQMHRISFYCVIDTYRLPNKPNCSETRTRPRAGTVRLGILTVTFALSTTFRIVKAPYCIASHSEAQF